MALPRDIPDSVRSLSAPELSALFRTLDAPDMDEMDGEFASLLLRQWHPVVDRAAQWLMNGALLPFRWTGKAFRPLSSTEGRGYNMFHLAGRTLRTLPMRTVLAPSAIDGRPSYQLVYAAFHSPLGYVRVVDELRRLQEGIYLGIGAACFAPWRRRLPFPFVLQGPVTPYERDIGWERRRFDLMQGVQSLGEPPRVASHTPAVFYSSIHAFSLAASTNHEH